MTSHCIVAIGDTHLQRSNPRNPDRLRALDQIIGQSLALPNLAAFLWPGDLFHARSTPQDRLDVAERLLRMAERAPVLIAKGNHDQDSDLEIFGFLKAAYPIYVVSEQPTTLRFKLATGVFASAFVLPYPNLSRLVAAGVPSSELFQAGRAALEDIFDFAAAELADARARGDLTLAMAHMAIGGCKLSNGQPAIGRELELDAALIQKLGAIPFLCAHIHEPQDIYGATFIGSITAQDFGEVTPRRYVRLRMLDTINWSLESCPLDTPKLYHVEARLTRDGLADVVVTAGPGGERQDAPPSWAGAEVRVRYRFAASERSVINDDVIREGFQDAARLHLDPVAVPDRDVRAPQVAAALTLEDKVVAYLETDGKSASPGVLAKLTALQQQDSADVLADVRVLIAKVSDVPAAVVLQPEEALF